MAQNCRQQQSPLKCASQAVRAQGLTHSSSPQGSGPFLQAPTRGLWCLAEWLALLQPIKPPRQVSVTLSGTVRSSLASVDPPLGKEPFLGGRRVGSSSLQGLRRRPAVSKPQSEVVARLDLNTGP